MKLLIPMILLIQLSAALYTPTPEGNWNGTLDVQGTQLRIVFHVTKTDSLYHTTMDSPDQNVSGIPVTVTNFSYPNLKFEIPGIGMVYEGVLSDTLITGKWMQSGRTFPLVFHRLRSGM